MWLRVKAGVRRPRSRCRPREGEQGGQSFPCGVGRECSQEEEGPGGSHECLLSGEKQKLGGTVFTLNARVQVVTVGVNDRNKIGDGVTGDETATQRARDVQWSPMWVSKFPSVMEDLE